MRCDVCASPRRVLPSPGVRGRSSAQLLVVFVGLLGACDGDVQPAPELDLSGIEERLDTLDAKAEAYGDRLEAAAPALDQWSEADVAERELAARPRARRRRRPRPRPPGGVECRASETEPDVKECRVQRSLLAAIDPERLRRGYGLWIPHYLDGEVAGFKGIGFTSAELLVGFGIRTGDVIRSVDGNRLTSEEEGLDALARAKTADRVTVEVVRSGASGASLTTYRIEIAGTSRPIRPRLVPR